MVNMIDVKVSEVVVVCKWIVVLFKDGGILMMGVRGDKM